jgi:surface polysaccharide O-acyltransferase-like enzyme
VKKSKRNKLQTDPQSERMLWADWMRITAVYLVTLVHVSAIGTNTVGTVLLFAIAKTCVPLFFMLSGALLLGKNESYSTFFTKRAKRLLIPWFFWSLIYTILAVLVFQETISSVFGFIVILKNTILTRFWFIPVIAGLYIVTPALRRFVQAAQKRDLAVVIICWFLIVSLLPFVRDTEAFPLHTDNSFLRQIIQYSGYYLLGYIVASSTLTIRHIPHLLSIFILSLAITTTTIVAGNYQNNHLFSYISPTTVLTTCSLFGLLFLWFKRKQQPTLNHRIIRLVSKASFGTLFAHELIFLLLLSTGVIPSIIKFQPLLPITVLFLATIVFMLSNGLIIMLQQLPIVKKFVA